VLARQQTPGPMFHLVRMRPREGPVEGAGTEVHRAAPQTRAALEWEGAAQEEAEARQVVQAGSRQSDRMRRAEPMESPPGIRAESEQAARAAAWEALPWGAQATVGQSDAKIPLQVVPAWTVESPTEVRAAAE
jgi:hypothetical protein